MLVGSTVTEVFFFFHFVAGILISVAQSQSDSFSYNSELPIHVFQNARTNLQWPEKQNEFTWEQYCQNWSTHAQCGAVDQHRS